MQVFTRILKVLFEKSEMVTDYNLLSPVHTFCNIVDNNDKIPYLYANSPLKVRNINNTSR